jgi:AAA+ superfamily predicted ATPase
MTDDPTLDALRQALAAGPDNIPLRRHLAETLLRVGRAEEAEREFRDCLRRDPTDVASRIGLARVFYRHGRFDESLVLAEEACSGEGAPPSGLILLARLHLRRGQRDDASRAYHRAITAQPELADDDLAAQFDAPAPERSAEPSDIVDGRVRQSAGGGGSGTDAAAAAEVERPKTGFSDVGGMDALKQTIRMKIIHPLTNPDLYKAYGKKIGGGIMLYGPPGCGKTHLARAVAGEIKASFLSIGINDVLDMWVGSSEKNLHQIFENARGHSPCVLFIDEVDALAASRSDMRQSAGRQVINQFLAEMDGLDASNDGLLILAATNAPWHVDSAFRRPGRFDRLIFVPPPDAPARAEILRIHLRGKPCRDIDCEAVAKKTDGFSGADLMSVVDQAVEARLEEALSKGTLIPITSADLLKAAKTVKATTKEWFSSARNHALYANQGGIYDEVLDYLGIKR